MKSTAGWLWFAVIQIISLGLMVIGWILLLPLAFGGLWKSRESLFFAPRQITVWRGGWFTWIWGNEEDGVTGAPFYQAWQSNPRLCAYLWSAWRNPVNNLRFIVKWQGGPFWRREFGRWYIQAGWYPNGYAVLSAGAK